MGCFSVTPLPRLASLLADAWITYRPCLPALADAIELAVIRAALARLARYSTDLPGYGEALQAHLVRIGRTEDFS